MKAIFFLVLLLLFSTTLMFGDMWIERFSFGKRGDDMIDLYSLHNENNMTVRITNYGGIIQSILLPDKDGHFDDVVLGFSDLEGYISDTGSIGCVVGRYANRIAGGKFSLDGVEYFLPQNEGTNCLHGGLEGFCKKIWQAKEFHGEDTVGLELFYHSMDGEEGFPGNLKTWVTYTLTQKNELIIEYRAQTDKPTPVNLTNHTYFNLGGHQNGDILRHILWINGDKYAELDEIQIPTGRILSVKGTPLDFTTPAPIGKRIYEDFDQLIIGKGYDQSILISQQEKLNIGATLFDPSSGRKLTVYTTEPVIQIYSSNHLNGVVGKNDVMYNQFGGFCLETQHLPDSPNQPEFPDTTLHPGDLFYSKTIFHFEIVNEAP